MSLLAEAHDAIQRNLKWFAVYVLMLVPVSAGLLTLDTYFFDASPEAAKTPASIQWEAATALVLAVVSALAQTLVFTRIGREMAHMMWRVKNTEATIRRFFPMWLLINLVVYAVQKVPDFVLGGENTDHPLAGPFLILMVIVMICSTPFGACFMWWGSVFPLKEALAPLGRNLAKTFMILFASGVFFFLCLDLLAMTQESKVFWPLIDVLFCYFDCFIFAATWALLIYDTQPKDLLDEGDL